MLATEIDLFCEKSLIVMSRCRLNRIMVWRIALHDDARSGASPAGPAGDLGEQAERPLSGAEIRQMKSGVRVDDPDSGHPGEIEPFGDHLSADHDVSLSSLNLAQQSFRTAGVAHGILIPAQDSRRWKSRRISPSTRCVPAPK